MYQRRSFHVGMFVVLVVVDMIIIKEFKKSINYK